MHELLLLQLTTGLVFKKDATSQPVKNLAIGDDIDIIRILYGLAALQSLLERGKWLGNITKEAIQRTASGRLVLLCAESQPSKCELTARDDDDARYFVHVGEKPQQIDDLVSLGVAFAELLIPPGNLPPALSATYREDLAAKIPRPAFPRSDRLRNQIVKSLLLSNKVGIQTTSEFLRHYVPLVRMTGDMKLKPAGWYDAMRAFPKRNIAGFVVSALAIVYSVVVWRDLQSSRSMLQIANDQIAEKQSEVKKLEGEKATLRQEVETLKSEVNSKIGVLQAEIDKHRPARPPEPTVSIAVVKNDLRYKWFENDANLKDDTRFQSLIKKTKIDNCEASYADQRLRVLAKAAKEWWKMVEDEATLEEIESRINGQTDSEIEKALEVWFAQARTPHDYVIELGKSKVPNAFKDYKFLVTIRHEDINKEIRATATANAELILVKPSGNALSSISLSWKAGQPINLYLESSSFYNWNDRVTTELKGGLALPLLVKRTFGSKEGFSLHFTVKGFPGLPGPPVASVGAALPPIGDFPKGQLPGGGPTPANKKTNPPAGGDAKANGKSPTTLLKPLDELK